MFGRLTYSIDDAISRFTLNKQTNKQTNKHKTKETKKKQNKTKQNKKNRKNKQTNKTKHREHKSKLSTDADFKAKQVAKALDLVFLNRVFIDNDRVKGKA